MIISASRRTDIPAFFGEWFMRRVEAGFFVTANPFNPAQIRAYSLHPDDVDAIAFWTKNPAPFSRHLDAIDRRGYRYYFGVTLNDYPAIIEPGVPPLAERIEAFRRLSDRIGPERVMWRYDPVIISSATPAEYHLERLDRLAAALAGHTWRMIISFLDFYRKVKPRLDKLGASEGITFTDIAAPEHRDQLLALAAGISGIAAAAGISVQTCSEAVDLESVGIRHGTCIDADYIETVLGAPGPLRRDANQRTECLCAHSADMGAYNTCLFQCAYCYADFGAASVRANQGKHFVDSPMLIGRPTAIPAIAKVHDYQTPRR
ncbi:MAG: DUF1848 domain-containing protein [Chloroflexota bacterium]